MKLLELNRTTTGGTEQKLKILFTDGFIAREARLTLGEETYDLFVRTMVCGDPERETGSAFSYRADGTPLNADEVELSNDISNILHSMLSTGTTEFIREAYQVGFYAECTEGYSGCLNRVKAISHDTYMDHLPLPAEMIGGITIGFLD